MKIASGLIAVITGLLLTACIDSTQPGDTDPVASAGGSGSTASHQGGAAASWGNALDFSFTTFDGRPGKISEFAGRPLVVNFWAAW